MIRQLLKYLMGVLAGLTANAIVWVYVFDHYERAWGRGGSLQVLSWMAMGCCLVVGLGALPQRLLAGPMTEFRHQFLAGITSGVFLPWLLYTTQFVGEVQNPFPVFLLILICAAVGVAATAATARRHNS